MISKAFDDHLAVFQQFLACKEQLDSICQAVWVAIHAGRKVLFIGNGGSAADAQHLAAEFSGRFRKERRALPGLALTTDTSALTAIGNDYGYEYVFVRQVQALAQEGDVLIGISTSGNSQNVLLAMEYARKHGVVTIGLSGNGGGRMNQHCDYNLVVPSDNTARIQEMHILAGHIICQYVDEKIVQQEP